jgi:hypothetical protein
MRILPQSKCIGVCIMKIVATYDSTVASAPVGYKTAIQSAIAFFETTFSDNITINITFDWKNLSGGLAQSNTYFNSYDYSTVVTALKTKAVSNDDFTMLARLPNADPLSNPTSSIYYNVSTAEAKALGLANGKTSDGTVTLGSGNFYTFDPNRRAVAGAIDAIGVLQHEISEVMSRSMGSDGAYYKTVLALCRYSPNGALNASSSYKNSYFSIDGKNMLIEMGEAGGDLGDWGASVVGDACGYASPGMQLTFSNVDIRSMDVIGYTIAATATAPVTSPSTPVTTPSTPGTVPNNTPAVVPTLQFNALDYIASYNDLIKAFGANSTAALAHWQNTGQKEGRKISFNGLDYIASNADLIKAFGANEQQGAIHYIQYGANEKRKTSFNGLDYIASNTDLIKVFGANAQQGATHYIQFGANEKRKTTFNGLDYIASNTDLIKAFGANAQQGATHYIQYGANEKRSTTFDGLAYIAQHSDLMKAFGANEQAGAAHFIQYGANENRKSAFDIMAYKAAHTDLAAKYTTNESFLTAYISAFATTGQQLV